LSGRDLAHGKPDPEIFLDAAAELHLPPVDCFVVEDAVAGVQAAKAGQMAALGVARADDAALLAAADADLVVSTLDEFGVVAVREGGWQARARCPRPAEQQLPGRSARAGADHGRVAPRARCSSPAPGAGAQSGGIHAHARPRRRPARSALGAYEPHEAA